MPGTLVRVCIGVGAAVAVVGAAVVVLVNVNRSAGGLGQAGGELRDYIGRQLAGIVNAYIEPELAFAELDYHAPGTVSLTDVTLTGTDGTRVLDVDRLVVTLAEAPRVGSPLRIAEVRIGGGRVNLLLDPEGGLRGLTPLLKTGDARAEAAQGAGSFRLSDVLVLNHVVIEQSSVVVDAGDGPMRFDGFEADLTVERASEDAGAPGGPGWYALAFSSGRAPGLRLDAEGRLNIDTFDAWLRQATARLELTPETIGTLPPTVADWLREADASGALTARASGSVPLRDPGGAEAEISADVEGFNFAAGPYRFPVDTLRLDAGMSGGIVNLRALRAELLRGRLDASGAADLGTRTREATLSWTLAGLDLGELIRRQEGEDAPDLAGIVTSSGSASTSLAAPTGRISGAGGLEVREGRLVLLPGLTELADLIDSTGLGSSASHTLDVSYELAPDGLRVTESTLETDTLVARVRGVIAWDGTLDLSANAGPLEKVQSLLGQAGRILGNLTDRLVKYRIRGPIADPSVSVDPLGLGG